MDTKVNGNGPVRTEELIEIDDEMLDDFTAFLAAKRRGKEIKAVSPVRQHRAIVRPEASSPDLDVLQRRIQQDADRGIGAIGRIKIKLFGDPIQKGQIDDLTRRIKSVAPRQRAELAEALITGLRDGGVTKVTSAINNMAIHLDGYEPDSDAAEVGRLMLDRNKKILPEQEDRIATSAERMIIEELGFDR